MTNAEEAELRGEIYGLKVLLFSALGFIAGRFDDPMKYMNELQDQCVTGIAHGSHDKVKPQNLRLFQAAAAGIVVQAVEAVKEAHSRAARPPTLQ